MKGTRNYFWYVQPLDSRTNEVFSRDPRLDIACLKGQKMPENMYLAPDRSTVQQYWNSRNDLNIRFEIFGAQEPRREGTRDAQIRKCTFLFQNHGFQRRQRKKPKRLPVKIGAGCDAIPF